MKALNYQQHDGLISTGTSHQKFQWITLFRTRFLTPHELSAYVWWASYHYYSYDIDDSPHWLEFRSLWGPSSIYDYSCLIRWTFI